jgi:hypothetical protein
MRKADAQRQHVVFRIKPAGRKLQSRGFQKAPGKAPRGPRKRVLPPLALYRPRDD